MRFRTGWVTMVSRNEFAESFYGRTPLGAGAVGGSECGWEVGVRLGGRSAVGGSKCGWEVGVRLGGRSAVPHRLGYHGKSQRVC